MFRLLFVVVILIIQACGEGLPVGQVAEDGLTAPADVLVVGSVSAVTLTWSTEPGITYNIYWSTDPELPVSEWNVITANISPYTHTNLTNQVTYYYRIAAVKDGKESELSEEKSATPSLTLLQAPKNPTVVSGDEQLSLSWAAVPGVEKYKIFWTSKVNEDPRLSGNVPRETPETSYVFGGLTNGQTYYFMIVSVAAGRESTPTEKVWGTPELTRPESPTNLAIVAVGAKSVTISWDPSPGAQGYRIYYSKGGPDFDLSTALFDDVAAGIREYTLRPLDEGVTYYVRIAAINENGTGEASVALEIPGDMPVTTDPSIATPTQVNVVVDGVTANLRWKSENLENTYRVYYATEPGVLPDNYFELENGGATEVYQTPKGFLNGLIVGKRYYLVVISISGASQSLPSEEKSFLVPIPKSQLDRADIQTGARLYDRWYQPLDTPSVFHPLWQEAAKDKTGNTISPATEADSWRCAECHGWDYKGRDGEYGYGSVRYTGFPGVKNAATSKTPEEIYNFIIGGVTSSGGNHAFADIPYDDAIDLTQFILEATNVSDFWVGNESNGDQIFNTPGQAIPQCTSSGCHTPFTDITDLEILPLALQDSAKAIHIIQYGFKNMPGGRTLQEARDVLRYLWMRQLSTLSDNFDQSVYDKTGAELNDQIAQGGMLYDRWWLARSEERLATPETNHPLWPQNITSINGAYTWRCQTCHGWDYRGSEGDYKAGPYFSGITGILQSQGLSDTPADLYQFLRSNEFHAYSLFLTDNDIYALTRFVMQMREDAANNSAPHQLLDATKEEPLQANVEAGKNHYYAATTLGGCDECHLQTGDNWFFDDIAPERNEIQTPASIAKENPWEFLHKIRFGQPGSTMTGLVLNEGVAPSTVVDVLAFAQTELHPDIKRGGRLYDNWWEENRLAQPVGEHGLWPAAGSALNPADTWRCVSCHGWDYQGTEGFIGLLNPVQDVKSFIADGTVINPNDHAFSLNLKQQDIADLTSFVTNPVEGVRSDINELLGGANSLQGQLIYHEQTPGNCVNCHGQEGTAIPSVDLKTLAGNFAQRFVHVARFGSPGSSMLPGLSRYTGLSAEQAANVHSYAVNFNSGNTIVSGLDRGGRLFDNWFVEMKASDPAVQDPVVVNPLWESRNPTIPDVQSLSDSWRCVNCHNWNYKGKDLLSDSPDADNLLLKLEQRQALYPTEEALTEYLVAWIKNGTGTQHNYGSPQSGLPTVLGEREINELVVFLLQGVMDSSTYIYNLDGSVIDADLVRGKEIYEGSAFVDINCESCHGATGEAIPPDSSRSLDIFALAKDNPWQFLHKVRFAAPASAMPAVAGVPGTSIKDAVDVLGYAQQQFEQRAP